VIVFSEGRYKMQKKLFDRYNRQLNYLRVSITDRCNLNCVYCAPESQKNKLSHKDILRYEEILRLVRIGVSLGITKVRVTGGEPLVRKDVIGFLNELGRIDGVDDLALTTNGLFLRDHLSDIKAAGIRRLNISLDSLNPSTYRQITGHDAFHKVWEGLQLAGEMGFSPIKINAVALRGVNESDLISLAELSFSYPFHIRFIEYMPVGKQILEGGRPLLTPEIKEKVSSLGTLLPVDKAVHDGPARRFRFKGAMGEIGFISPLSHHFCSSCNRLRLTASGKLRVCLLSDRHTDLKAPLRSGCSDQELGRIIAGAVRHKPLDHNLTDGQSGPVENQMSAIGG
jgi:cyclic pyranopterin phosphate synthase